MRRFVVLVVASMAISAGVAGGAVTYTTFVAPAWSPDGASIAWVSAGRLGSQVWTSAADGTSPRTLGPVYDGIAQLAWTSSGIVLDSNSKLYLLRPDGSSTKLGAALDQTFSIDGHGRKVASGVPGCPSCRGQVQILDVGTKKITRVGLAAEANDVPSLSPDGKQVAYGRRACAPKGGVCGTWRGVWVAPVTGGTGRRLAVDGHCPVWSGDGKSIAYLTRGGDLRVIPARGGTSALLAKGVVCTSSYLPSWSADAKQLAFVAHDNTLAIADARTHKIVARTPRTAGAVVGLDWSPDGSSLVVTARPAGVGTCASLWHVDAAAGTSMQLHSCT